MWQVLDLLKKVDLNMLKAGVPLSLSVPFSASAADQQWNEFLSPHMKPLSCLKFETSGVLCRRKHYGWRVTGRFREAAFLSKQHVEVSPEGETVPVRGQLLACRESFVWSQTGVWTCRAPVGSLEQCLLLDWVLCEAFHCQRWVFHRLSIARPPRHRSTATTSRETNNNLLKDG